MASQIKAQILQLPDEEIGPLANWLNGYYNGEVWDRQMVADVERLGEEEFIRRLSREDEFAAQRAAVLRLMNSYEPTTEEKRQQFLTDLFLVVGEPMEDFLKEPVEDSTEWVPD